MMITENQILSRDNEGIILMCPQKCLTTTSPNNTSQTRPTTTSHNDVPQQSPTTKSHNNVLQPAETWNVSERCDCLEVDSKEILIEFYINIYTNYCHLIKFYHGNPIPEDYGRFGPPVDLDFFL